MGDKLDYSGYDRENWVKRHMKTHKQAAKKYKNAKTKAEQELLLRQEGVRYSVLLILLF